MMKEAVQDEKQKIERESMVSRLYENEALRKGRM